MPSSIMCSNNSLLYLFDFCSGYLAQNHWYLLIEVLCNASDSMFYWLSSIQPQKSPLLCHSKSPVNLHMELILKEKVSLCQVMTTHVARWSPHRQPTQPLIIPWPMIALKHAAAKSSVFWKMKFESGVILNCFHTFVYKNVCEITLIGSHT